MADRFWSLSLGQKKQDIAETGTTTAGAHVEVRITYTATGLSKQEALKALELLEYKITEDTWPPV